MWSLAGSRLHNLLQRVANYSVTRDLSPQRVWLGVQLQCGGEVLQMCLSPAYLVRLVIVMTFFIE